MRRFYARLGLALVTVGLALGLSAPGASAIRIASVSGSFTDVAGNPERQAGSHPDVSFSFRVETDPSSDPLNWDGEVLYAPFEAFHRVTVDMPVGLVGNPQAIETCPIDKLTALMSGNAADCPASSQVGIAALPAVALQVGIFNIEPPSGYPAMFAFNAFGVVVKMLPSVRGGDYGITIDSGKNNSGQMYLSGADVTLWGVPADPVHDARRYGPQPGSVYPMFPSPSTSPRRPFLTLPTACPGSPLVTTAHVDGWNSIGAYDSMSSTVDYDGDAMTITGCDRVPFSPSIDVKPTARRAGAPTGLDVRLDVPQSTQPDELASAHVKDVSVLLPEGMAVSPSSAAGLGGCSPAEIGLGSDAAPSCPRSSKLGTVTVETPLLREPLQGDVILATPDQNPFGSLLALYIVADGPGVQLKLPGRIDANAVTGQLTTTFSNNPQLPFSSLSVRFDGGENASLMAPKACGVYETKATVTSWSGKSVGLTSPMTIDQNCGPRGFAPGINAGSADPKAGSSSTFALTVVRQENDRELKAIKSVRLPEGLLANVGSVPLCGETQAATGTCPETSRVGRVQVAAGAGTQPLAIPQPGKAPTGVFLTGPYKGAPYGLSITVPAQAGPFDLGTVLLRSALHVDRRNTAITAETDDMPTILQGIPLNIREVRLIMDRAAFMLNPTNCAAKRIDARLASIDGDLADIGNRFQVGDCGALPFRPRMTFKVGSRGKTSNGKRTPFEARLWMTPGQANNRAIEVTLPKILNARLDVVDKRTACTIEQFNADRCPQIVGAASAVTPLLRDPLRGPAYFVYNPARRLPDLVVRLKGQVNVDLVGKVTITRALELQTTFDTIPDVPITQFQLSLMSGPRNGPIGVTRNLCAASTRKALAADLAFTAQSGKKVSRAQKISVAGCGRASRTSGRRAGRGRSASKAKRAGSGGRAGK